MLTIYDPETAQSEYITTTPEHPFYLAGNVDNTARPRPEAHENLSNKWVGAGHLKTGDKLRQADGTLGEVRYVNTITQTRTMYNLSVQEAHTFFVGNNSWLVHNCSRALDKALGGTLKDGRQAHHLIPEELFKNQPILKRAQAGGFDMDAAYNGVLLPDSLSGSNALNRVFHRGSHPNYTKYVEGELTQLANRANSGNWSDAKIAQETQKLTQKLLQTIQSKPSG